MTEAITEYFRGLRVCVTGGAGFLGRVVCRRLADVVAGEVIVPRSNEYDLTDASAVARLFDDARPDVVLHLAAEVGGIGANQKHPGRFFYANMAMGLHLIEEVRRRKLKKFVQIGTVCAYPKHCVTPFAEGDLWHGYPEETNAPYGVAKRSLGVMLDAYHREYGLNGLFLIPANLYGPGDNFHPESSHVIAAMIRNFCLAASRGDAEVTCWGSGAVSREFLYVEDAAEAILTATALMNDPAPLNIGTGHETTIAELAAIIAELCGYRGTIAWDSSRPDGQPRRRLDTSQAELRLGWRAGVSLRDGLRRTVAWWRDIGSKQTVLHD